MDDNALTQDIVEDEAPESAETPPEDSQAAEPAATEEQTATEDTTDVPPTIGEDERLKAEIAELEAKKKKAEEEARYWNKQKREARRDFFKPDEPAADPVQAERKPLADAPKEADFDTYEQYEAALRKHEVQAEVDARLTAYEQQQKSAKTEAQRADFVAHVVQKGIEKYPDFGEVATYEGNPTLPITGQMLDIMAQLDNPADVAYHLGKNINVCASIARMDAVAAARELTKIDLSAGEQAAQTPAANKPVTNAPPPIKPTRSENVITKDPEKMTQAELEVWWKEQGYR
jgi:hypothetical protein